MYEKALSRKAYPCQTFLPIDSSKIVPELAEAYMASTKRQGLYFLAQVGPLCFWISCSGTTELLSEHVCDPLHRVAKRLCQDSNDTQVKIILYARQGGKPHTQA